MVQLTTTQSKPPNEGPEGATLSSSWLVQRRFGVCSVAVVAVARRFRESRLQDLFRSGDSPTGFWRSLFGWRPYLPNTLRAPPRIHAPLAYHAAAGEMIKNYTATPGVHRFYFHLREEF
jgi:hypothetical protein